MTVEFKLDKEGKENRGWGEGGRIDPLRKRNSDNQTKTKTPRKRGEDT